MENKKISLDFDYTLSRKDVQEFAKKLVNLDFDVWIVTSRFSNEEALLRGFYGADKKNKEIYDIAELCGIKKENIVFTNKIDKINYLKDKNFTIHLDDDIDELMAILESGDLCKPINVNYFDWENACMEILENK
jgi:translation elongation factor EF-1alpha